MAYDSVRKQLDQLLGVDRNELHPRQKSRDVVKYHDPKVCKNFLLGLCPSTLAIKHRQCAEACDKVHNQDTVEQFRKDDAAGLVREKGQWARDLASVCRAIVYDEDRRIQGIARRLRETYGFTEPASAIMVRGIETLQALGMLLKDITSAGGSESEGEVEEGEAAVRRLAERVAARKNLEEEPERDDAEFNVLNSPVPASTADAAHVSDDEIKILNVAQGGERNTKHDKNNDANAYSPGKAMSENAATSPTPKDENVGGKSSPDMVATPGSPNSQGSKSILSSSSEHGALRRRSSEKAKVDSENVEREANGTGDADNEQFEPAKPVSPRRQIAEIGGIGPDGLLLNKEYKLRVCGQCGGLISLHDAESRLITHYTGKAHTSAVAVRSKLHELDMILHSDSLAKGDRYSGFPRAHARDEGDRRHFGRENYSGRRDARGRPAIRSPSPRRGSGRRSPHFHDSRDNNSYQHDRVRGPPERGRIRSRSRSFSRSRSRSYSVSRSPSPNVPHHRHQRVRSPIRRRSYQDRGMRYDESRHPKRPRSRSPLRYSRRHKPRHY